MDACRSARLRDPHRDRHAVAVLEVRTGVVVFEAGVAADSGGYAEALRLADQHAPGRRAFAVEGTGSFGAGLSRFLTGNGEQVFEVSRLRRERRSGGKTDAPDAVRAARSASSAASSNGSLESSLPSSSSNQASGRSWPLRSCSPGHTRPDRKRGRLRSPRRRRHDPRLLRPNHPLPVRPKRRPQAQSHPPPNHRHQAPHAPPDDRLHQPENPGRKKPARGNPLPQALPRPQPLPAAREPTANDLTDIEPSLAHATLLGLPPAQVAVFRTVAFPI